MLQNIKYEIKLWQKGIVNVTGIDEVGRGCLAGPLVTAAVIWPPTIVEWVNNDVEKFDLLSQIKDSKKLSAAKRNTLAQFIKENSTAYAIYEIDSVEIDKHGVGEANKKALKQVVINLSKKNSKFKIEHVLIDHFKVFTQTKEYPETSITNGDELSISIASASIIAKVYRDTLMQEHFHKKYPQYGFAKHVGYGTKTHKEAIFKYGYSPIHRQSFKLK